MQNTLNIRTSDLASHLRKEIVAYANDMRARLVVATAVDAVLASGKRVDKRIADKVREALAAAYGDRVQVWYTPNKCPFTGGNRFGEIGYRLNGSSDYGTVYVMRHGAPYEDWRTTYADGPTRLAERIAECDAVTDDAIADIADRISEIRALREALADAVDGTPFSGIVSETREPRY